MVTMELELWLPYSTSKYGWKDNKEAFIYDPYTQSDTLEDWYDDLLDDIKVKINYAGITPDMRDVDVIVRIEMTVPGKATVSSSTSNRISSAVEEGTVTCDLPAIDLDGITSGTKDITFNITYDIVYDDDSEIPGGDETKTVRVMTANYAFTITPSYIYSLQNPLYVSKDGSTPAFHLNYGTLYDFNTGLTHRIAANRITVPSLTVNYAEASSDIVTKQLTYTDAANNTYVGQLNIYVKRVAPASIEVIENDTNVYYDGRSNVFRAPVGQTFKIVYNNGTKENFTPTDFTYRKGASQSAEELEIGESYTSEELPFIFYEHEVTYNEISFTVFGQYAVQYTPDAISSVAITPNNSITRGNYLSKNDFTVTATFQSGATEVLSNSDFSITSPITRILSGAISELVLSVRGLEFTINSPAFTLVNPTLSGVEIVGDLVLAYNNNLSMIDLTQISYKLKYNETDYETPVSFADFIFPQQATDPTVVAQVSSGGTWSDIFATEDEDNYNGTTVLDIASLTTGSADCKFVFTFFSDFDDNDTITEEVPFSVLAMTEIKGISILQPYTEYHVGEKFLNENDTTMVAIYWEDSGTLNSKVIPLSSNYPSLSIFPQKDYEFVNIDASKQITVKSILNSNVSAEYTIKVLPESQTSNTRIHDLVGVWASSAPIPETENEPATVYTPENGKGVLLLYRDEDTQVISGVRRLSNSSAKLYGYIDNILDKNLTAKVVLFDDYMPEIEGSANMEITYPCYHQGEADFINNSSFGCLFGANNSVNRLFVSGNSEVANADWHTAEINLTDYEGDIEHENGNFSYIPSETQMFYGETDNAVIGYDIISNDKLLVLKTKSDKEKTVYFRVPITVRAVDAAGTVSTDIEGNALYQEEFGLVKGNNSVAGISPTTIVNFNGDTLFVDSDNHVSGMDLVGIIGDNQRYANSRSKLIDNKLAKYDLSNSTLWTNNKYLFLSVKGLGLFVAHFEAKTEAQYEWWFLTSHNPSVFIEIDGEIYFGNDDGNLCKLFNGKFEDIKKIFVGKEQILLVSFLPDEERILTDSSVIEQLDQNNIYFFKALPNEEDYTKNIYYEIAESEQDFEIDTEHNSIVVIADGAPLRENRTYYLNYREEDVLDLGGRYIPCEEDSELAVFGAKYTLKQIQEDDEDYDNDHISFKLLNADGEECDLSEITGEIVICERLDHEVEIFSIDDERCTFKLRSEGEELNIVTYGAQNPGERQVAAEIIEHKGIEAYYITSPMLANSLNTFKTIWQIVLTNDTELSSTLQVGVASNKIPFYQSKTIAAVSKGGMGISFADLVFSRADFDKTVVPRTYNINKVLGMQKFICFAFKNEKGNNAVLSEMAVTYTLPFPSYGSE